MIFDFIWDGKPAKIKKSTITGEKKQGGLKMIDFNILNKALKVAWIPRLQSRSDASWEIIPNAAPENYGGISFPSQCNYDVKFLQFNNLSDFYSDILKHWQTMRSAFQKNTLPPRNEIIWNNHLTNRFNVAVRLFSNSSQMTSKCGKNKKVAHEAIAECVTDVLTTF